MLSRYRDWKLSKPSPELRPWAPLIVDIWCHSVIGWYHLVKWKALGHIAEVIFQVWWVLEWIDPALIKETEMTVCTIKIYFFYDFKLQQISQ